MTRSKSFLFFALFLITTTTSWAATHDAPPPTPQADLSTLPVAAQASISASLGRNDAGYWAAEAADALRMQNSQNQLAMEFSDTGVKVRKNRALWEFQYAGAGYGEALDPGSAVAAEASANQIIFKRGTLTEWYKNGPLGLEQGFTLTKPPGKANGKPLTVALSLSGDLAASIEANAKRLRLVDHNGQVVLRYSGLAASDASGRELRSWLELKGAKLLLRVDDRGATYPLVIDPMIQLAKLTPSDDSGMRFVAIDGDTVVVGARENFLPFGHWAAYVFVKPANGWGNATETAKLTPSDVADHNSSVGMVAISGDTIVLGSSDSNTHLGAAYVFVKPSSGWVSSTETAKLTASDGAEGFGVSVSVSGGTIVVGAPYATVDGITMQGAAYVFVKPAAGWVSGTETAKLMTSDERTWAYMASSVAINGDTVVLGTYNSATAAYLFVKPPTGWVSAQETAKLTASDYNVLAAFGSAVAIDGDTVVVGSYAAVGPNGYQGAAYVYTKPQSGWATATETARLTASDGAANDLFGSSVGISGDKIIVGAYASSIPSYDRGAAYLFVRPANGWLTGTETQRLSTTDPGNNFEFGWGVAISGDTVAVIPNGIDPGSTNVPGRSVYIFGEEALYTFSGFFPPMQNLPAMNDAQAGQTIPIKWRIIDAAGAGVTDPLSFTGMTSYSVSCPDFAGSSTPVGETAAGRSGLQNMGGGYWQFNWSTPGSYAGSCRVLQLTLKDGSIYKLNFEFR